ncbi:MAG: RsmE family RNA methyltransferase [Oscillospiraceae bacterium]
MPRFFVDNIAECAEISGADANHIAQSLRMKIGEEVTLCDRNGYDYHCVIEEFTENSVFCKVLDKCLSKSEPSIKLTLFQAMPKLDKLETIIQKSVELGVSRIVPVLTSRCVSRPDEKSFAKKLERYQKISLEAAKQSGRGIIPEISGIITLQKAFNEMILSDIPLICYEGGGKKFKEIGLAEGKSVSLIIGSEGGFDAKEVENAVSMGITPIWLGDRILRCETAPLAAISIIMNLTNNM